jgi:zinc/manganese transport system substrate-binding protein
MTIDRDHQRSAMPHRFLSGSSGRSIMRIAKRHRFPREASAAVLPLSFSFMVSLLAGCAPQPLAGDRPAGRRGEPLLPVVATAAPVTLLAREVGAGCAQVEPLVSGARDSHQLPITPTDLARLGRARVLVINGLGLEPELPALLRSVAHPSLRLIDSSRGVTPVLVRGRPDPHIWLDPRRALGQVEAIRDGLVAADPSCRARYTANADALRRSLLELDRELAAQLAPFRGGVVVGSHAFMASFADRYGLRAEGLVAIPESSPTPADLRRVLALLASGGPRALVVQPGENGGSIVSLGDDLKLQPVPIDAMEAGFSGASAAAEGDPLGPYATVQRGNARQLVAAFRASLARGGVR